MENKIKKFVKDNNLDFTGTGSELNGNCVILAGWADHMGISNADSILDVIDISDEGVEEFQKVFEYALRNNYGTAWSTKAYEKMYKY